MFIDPYQFPFTKALEENTDVFINTVHEHNKLFCDPRKGDLKDMPEHPVNKIVRGDDWASINIWSHNDDWSIHSEENRKGIEQWVSFYAYNSALDEIRSLIKSLIPNHGTCALVRLAAGTRLRPHVGIPGAFLRMHLGLIVPEGDIGIQVEKEKRKWEVGKALCFDDKLLHRAWNNTDEDRYILSVDFNPEVSL